MTEEGAASSDDGMESEGDSAVLDSTGPAAECGNGEIEPGEDCDQGDMTVVGRCSTSCTFAFDVGWTSSVNGPANGEDVAGDAVIDAGGVVYVVGSITGADTGRDLWVAQYLPGGMPGWTMTWDGGGATDDLGFGIALFPDGNLAVVGRTVSPQGANVTLAVRVGASDGAIEWAHVGEEPGASLFDGSSLVDVAVDSAGDVIAVGQTELPEGPRPLVRKYDGASGDPIWSEVGGPDVESATRAFGVAVADERIVVVVADTSTNLAATSELRVYDSAGVAGESFELRTLEAQSIAMDREGAIVLAGWKQSSSEDPDIVVLKVDAAFTELWRVEIDGPAGGFDFGEAIAVDEAGDAYLVGQWSKVGAQRDVVVRKFSGSDGSALWGDTYDNERANLFDRGLGVAVGTNGDVVATALETVIGEGLNGWVRLYTQP